MPSEDHDELHLHLFAPSGGEGAPWTFLRLRIARRGGAATSTRLAEGSVADATVLAALAGEAGGQADLAGALFGPEGPGGAARLVVTAPQVAWRLPWAALAGLGAASAGDRPPLVVLRVPGAPVEQDTLGGLKVLVLGPGGARDLALEVQTLDLGRDRLPLLLDEGRAPRPDLGALLLEGLLLRGVPAGLYLAGPGASAAVAALEAALARGAPLAEAWAAAGGPARAGALLVAREGGEDLARRLARAAPPRHRPHLPPVGRPRLSGTAPARPRALLESLFLEAPPKLRFHHGGLRSAPFELHMALPPDPAEDEDEEGDEDEDGDGEGGAPRLTQAWLSPEASVAPPLPPVERLRVEVPTWLQVQVGPALQAALGGAAFPEDEVAADLAAEGQVHLDLAVFAPSNSVRVQPRHATILLPRVGPSGVAAFRLTALRPGRARLRVGLYHRNRLLQSLVVQLPVDAPGARGEGQARVALDWAEGGEPGAPRPGPSPAASLFVNDDDAGNHWLGAFAQGEGAGLRAQQLWELSDAELDAMAASLRGVLGRIEGRDSYWAFAEPAPLAAQVVQERAARIVSLAQAAYRLYEGLFLARADLDVDEILALQAALEAPGLVHLARTRPTAVSLPWAALYDRFVDTESSQVALCPVFLAELQANRWVDGRLVEVHDHVDDPVACRGQSTCPLSGPAPERFVCPYGFWGFRHMVEQPIQHLTPTEDGGLPPELVAEAGAPALDIPTEPGQPVRLLLASYPDFPDTPLHGEQLRGLPGLDVRALDDRQAILAALRTDTRPLVYFFCHGRLEDAELKLEVGPSGAPDRFIASANLPPPPFRWTHRPLVILNACDSGAMSADRINKFLARLRLVGASGVVGTEIAVWTDLARPVGVLLLERLLAGDTLGEAFLAMRRHLLRQLNPLGLVYTFFAPAALRLGGRQARPTPGPTP